MSADIRRSLVGAIAVGVAAFLTGLGMEAWQMGESVARDALTAGIEAIVAALVAALGLTVAQHQAEDELAEQMTSPPPPEPPRYPPEAS